MTVTLSVAVLLGSLLGPHAAASPMVAPAAKSAPASSRLAHAVAGRASWYCCTRGYGEASMVAAAGPALRRALGRGWRGTVVRVNGIAVRLVDWCQCRPGTDHEVLIDLQPGAFRRLASLGAGITSVTVSW